jgi:CheY-like chemotaxis protein
VHPRLLVLEDDPDSREMLAWLLEAAGYNVVAAATSAAAVHAMERGGFDLVLADLRLGDDSLATSWSEVDRIVQLARPAQVGLLTGWNVTADEAPTHSLAFVLRKPCTRTMLVDQLATTFGLPALDPAKEQTVRSYFDAIQARRYKRLESIVASDVVYELPGTHARFSNVIRGRDEFLKFTEQTFDQFTEPRFEIEAIRPLPGGALVEYVGSWREEPAVRQMPGAVMFELDEACIKRINVRVNTDELR